MPRKDLTLISALLASVCAAADVDAPALRGIRIEMKKEQVNKVLERVADYKSQDENQEVWRFKNDSAARSIFVGYAPDNRVRYITIMAKENGTPLDCKPLRDVRKAQQTGVAGNYTFTRPWKEHHEEFVAIAKGPSRDKLTSCSVKKVGVGMEDEEEEKHERAPDSRSPSKLHL